MPTSGSTRMNLWALLIIAVLAIGGILAYRFLSASNGGLTPGSTEEPVVIRSDTVPIGVLDVPIPDETVSGVISVAGWALDEVGIDRVEIYVDGVYLADAAYGSPRPDVAENNTGFTNAFNSGFEFELDTTQYADGIHVIQTVAYNKAGNSFPLVEGGGISVAFNNQSGDALFNEDFEDGSAEGIGFSSDDSWEIVTDEDSNKVYQVDNRNGSDYPSFSFGLDDWRNYRIEYKIKLIDSTETNARVGLQFRSNGVTYYVLDVGDAEVFLGYSLKDDGWQELETQTPVIERNAWHDVLVDVLGDEIHVYLDGSELQSATDSQIASGWVMLFATPGSFIQVDDIQVVSLEN